jgi:phospholipase C
MGLRGEIMKQLSRCCVTVRSTALAVLFVPLVAADHGAQMRSESNQELITRYRIESSKEPKLSAEQVVHLLRQKIKYVFVLYQENRSFDSYFATFPGADGLFSRPPEATPGFIQPLINTDGTAGSIRPFRIGPMDRMPSCQDASESCKLYAADTDDVDHSHPSIVAKIDFTRGAPRMDAFALTEERKYSPSGNPLLVAKQMGELTMAYEDCDTVPLLWRYASRFVLFDRIFQEMIGPSTLGNIAIIAAQTGQTQWALHPDQAYADNGSQAPGVPVLNDNDPFWGSPKDPTAPSDKMPFNFEDFELDQKGSAALNLTFASLPLTLAGSQLDSITQVDRDPQHDLADVREDIPYISKRHQVPVEFGWYQEGYDREPTDPDDGPEDASGLHASYITHHNGPQYFGYVSNNPKMRRQLHGLEDFFKAVDVKTLPASGGVFFVKGGYQNGLGLKPADPDPSVQKNFVGDDDHPAYSDAQISEALVATAINKIAASPYWLKSLIIVTWDDSEGDYDHVPPPLIATGPDHSPISDGPRVPLILISPYARAGYIAHEPGTQASVVKLIDTVFDLPPLALLPDEQRGRELGKQRFGEEDLGPEDALTKGIDDLTDAFDPARLTGEAAPLPASYVEIPESLVMHLPEETGYGCQSLGILTTERALGFENHIPPDFNPRPKTNPSKANRATP